MQDPFKRYLQSRSENPKLAHSIFHIDISHSKQVLKSRIRIIPTETN